MDIEKLLLDYKELKKERKELDIKINSIKKELSNSGIDSIEFDNVEMKIDEIERVDFDKKAVQKLINLAIDNKLIEKGDVDKHMVKRTFYKKITVK